MIQNLAISGAYVAPGAPVAAVVDAIYTNWRGSLPRVLILRAECDESDITMGVPCLLFEHGLEGVVELPIDELESEQFKQFATTARADLARLH